MVFNIIEAIIEGHTKIPLECPFGLLYNGHNW